MMTSHCIAGSMLCMMTTVHAMHAMLQLFVYRQAVSRFTCVVPLSSLCIHHWQLANPFVHHSSVTCRLATSSPTARLSPVCSNHAYNWLMSPVSCPPPCIYPHLYRRCRPLAWLVVTLFPTWQTTIQVTWQLTLQVLPCLSPPLPFPITPPSSARCQCSCYTPHCTVHPSTEHGDLTFCLVDNTSNTSSKAATPTPAHHASCGCRCSCLSYLIRCPTLLHLFSRQPTPAPIAMPHIHSWSAVVLSFAWQPTL